MDYLSHGDWAKHFQSSIHSFNEGMKTAKYDHITIITYQISFLPSPNYLLCQRRMCVLTVLEFFFLTLIAFIWALLLYIIERIGWNTLKDSSCIQFIHVSKYWILHCQCPTPCYSPVICVFMTSWGGIIFVIDHAAQPRSECWILVTGLILVSLL